MGTVKVFAQLRGREVPKESLISPLGAPVPFWKGWGDDGCFVPGWKSYGLVMGCLSHLAILGVHSEGMYHILPRRRHVPFGWFWAIRNLPSLGA